MTQSIPKFKTVVKDRLFYDRYNYCLAFHVDEASCLRDLSHENIDLWIERRRTWREISQQRWATMPSKTGTVLARRWREITQDTVDHLHVVADALLLSDVDYKLVVSVDQVWIYSNDIDFLTRVSNLEFLGHKTWTQAQAKHPKNTIVLKRSHHQYRSYFKTKALTAQQKDNLEDFLYNHRDTVRLAPSLQRWVDLPFTGTQDYFFVDHDSLAWTTMLSLVVPGILRKTLPIIVGK